MFTPELLPEQPQKECQDQAHNDAGNNREVEAEVAASVIDIAGEFAEPAFADAYPKQKAHAGHYETQDEERFAELVHRHSSQTKPKEAR